MKSPDPPQAPAPGTMAKQQLNQNRKFGLQQVAFNRPNQTDQFGNTLSWVQTGKDAQGNPLFEARQGLGAMGQQYATGLSGLGQRYFDQAGNTSGLSSNDALDRALSFATGNLNPRFEREREAEISRLRNQGLDVNHEAYRNALNDLALQKNEALNNLVTGLQGQMFSQNLAQRQQGMNELQPGVAFGQNVLSPQLVNAPQVSLPTADMGQLNAMNLAQQNLAYQGKLAQQQGMLGGLASIGGTLATLPFGGIGGAAMAGLGGAGRVISGTPGGFHTGL